MFGMRKTIEKGEDCGMLDSYNHFKGISNSERYLADLTGFWKLPKAI